MISCNLENFNYVIFILFSFFFLADNISEETELKVARMASAAEDWRTGKSVIECNRYMLENQVHTDVKFNVKSTAISAHRSMLISRSQVFENLLTGRSSLDIIDVPDIEPDVFRNMLRYIFVCMNTISDPLMIYCIGGLMVNVLASSALGREFEPQSANQGLTNWYLLHLHYSCSIKAPVFCPGQPLYSKIQTNF